MIFSRNQIALKSIKNSLALTMAKAALIVFLIVFSLFQGVLGEVSYEANLKSKTGENANFNFTTKHGNPILGVQFGLKGEGDNLKKKFLSVTQVHGIVCGDDFNSTEGRRYKNRVFFVGNITAGRAWFKITGVDENDTNIYQVGVREKSDEKYEIYTVKLFVERRNGIPSPTTPSVSTKQTKTEPFNTNGTTGIWTTNTTNVPITKTTIKIKIDHIEVNRAPPYRLLIAANAIAFVYSLYTLYVKTRINRDHCRATR